MPSSEQLKLLGNYGEGQAREYLRNKGFEIYCYGSDLVEPSDRGFENFSQEVVNKIHYDCRKDDFEEILLNSDFNYLNSVIHQYIINLWAEHCKHERLPYDGREIITAMREGLLEEAERMKDANRAALKKNKFPNGHPGRFDFIGLKDNKYYAIEVKVNGSIPSYWQKLRLLVLKHYGIPTMVVKVLVEKNKFDDIFLGDEVECKSIEVEDDPSFNNISIPSSEEIKSMLQAHQFATPELDELYPDPRN